MFPIDVLRFSEFRTMRNHLSETLMLNDKSLSEKEIKKKTFIYSDYLLKNICQEDPNSHFSLYKTAENIFGKTYTNQTRACGL